MKKLTFGIIALAIIIAVLTNPKKALHNEQLTSEIINSIEDKRISNHLISSYIKKRTSYNNYVLFSVSGSKKRNYTIGLFGNIIVMNRHYLDITFNKVNTAKTHTTSERNWKKILKVKNEFTGYISSSYGWNPSIWFDVIRISNKSNKEYISIKVDFYDAKRRKLISSKKGQIAPYHGNKKDFLFKSTENYSNYNRLNIIAKVYINNQLIKEVKIDNDDLFEKRRKKINKFIPNDNTIAETKITAIKVYKGLIDNKYPITMELLFNKNEVKGSYYYNKIGKHLTIKGSYKEDVLELNVVDTNNKTFEQFLGTINNNQIVGEWQKLTDTNWKTFKVFEEK